MKILITGATGFVGRNFVDKIIGHTIGLVVLEKKEARDFYGKNFILIESKSDKFKEEVRKFNPELVIHLASYLTSKQDTETLKKLLDANIVFGSMLLDALMETDVKYFVNTGSFAEYIGGPEKLYPAYLYAATKIAFRQILNFYRKLKGFKVVQVVPYTIYGLNDTRKKVMDYIMDALDVKEPIEMTKGEQVLDFIYITDVADFYLALIENIKSLKEDYHEYHLGTGKGTKIKLVAEMVEVISGKKANIKWGALHYRKMDVMKAVALSEKAEKELGWKAKVTIKDDLKMMIEAKE